VLSTALRTLNVEEGGRRVENWVGDGYGLHVLFVIPALGAPLLDVMHLVSALFLFWKVM